MFGRAAPLQMQHGAQCLPGEDYRGYEFVSVCRKRKENAKLANEIFVTERRAAPRS